MLRDAETNFRPMTLQWVRRPITPVMLCGSAFVLRHRASMGPGSENAGYAIPIPAWSATHRSFNGSGVRERRLWRPTGEERTPPCRKLQWVRRLRTPVMPAGVEVRGARRCFNGSGVRERRLCATAAASPKNDWLQWVRRPRTPVMQDVHNTSDREVLQWVRRPRTPVILNRSICSGRPFGFNGSRVRERRLCWMHRRRNLLRQLQWVRRPRTPVMLLQTAGYQPRRSCFNGSGVRERRLCPMEKIESDYQLSLQWVRRPRTPVMLKRRSVNNSVEDASMGPASENAGYASAWQILGGHNHRFNGSGVRECRVRPPANTLPATAGFNGSGVRERRLCGAKASRHSLTNSSFNGSGVRERRLCEEVADVRQCLQASMGPASENAGYASLCGCMSQPVKCFNGSGVRERRLCGQWPAKHDASANASMGPASENAGYADDFS